MQTQWFKWLSLLTGLLYLSLFYQLLFTPVQMLQGFGVGADAATIYLARRISVLMLGFAVLHFLGCRLARSPGRTAVAVAVAVNMGGFAIHSFWGSAHGLLTDPAIPVIGGLETFIAIAFAALAITDVLALRRVSAVR